MAALAAILTADQFARVKAMHADNILDSLARHEIVSEIYLSLPEDSQKKLIELPLPSQLEKFPEMAQYKAIYADTTTSFEEKGDKIKEFLISLPADVDAQLREAMKDVYSS